TAHDSRFRIARRRAARPKPEPFPHASVIGIFAFEPIGQGDRGKAVGLIALPQSAHALDMFGEIGDDALSKWHDTILVALGSNDKRCPLFKVDMLDTQANTLHETKARAVGHAGHELVRSEHQVEQ